MKVDYTSETVTKVSKLFQAVVADKQVELAGYMLKRQPSLINVEHGDEKCNIREYLAENKPFEKRMIKWISKELD